MKEKPWTVEWTEHEFGKPKPRSYRVKVDKEHMLYILGNLLVAIPGVKISYRIYKPNGTLYKRGKI